MFLARAGLLDFVVEKIHENSSSLAHLTAI